MDGAKKFKRKLRRVYGFKLQLHLSMHLRDHKTVESIIKVFSIKYAYGIFSGLVSSLIVLTLFFGKVQL